LPDQVRNRSKTFAATRTAQHRADRQRAVAFLGARTRTEEKLNAVAKALSALVPIFEHAESSALGAQPILSSELARGRFKSGAKEFHSDRGKRGPHFLAVRATDAEYALKVLKEARY
jgi:hypothetical protein